MTTKQIKATAYAIAALLAVLITLGQAAQDAHMAQYRDRTQAAVEVLNA